jgi:pSer/pThr/pTyr-binding forkhead associated (FHA) protein
MPVAWVIGVAESCDLRVDSPYVSGRHCRLERVAEGWVLEDLGSTNGTFINGSRISGEQQLHLRDEIRVGETVLRWEG